MIGCMCICICVCLLQRRRAERLKGLGDQIAELWDRLKVRCAVCAPC
jgi:hypothetical protein